MLTSLHETRIAEQRTWKKIGDPNTVVYCKLYE